jgi:uncharacterized protein YndB with AHSA1/START domain
MANIESIEIERVFDFSVDKLWNAWTNPDEVKKWWGPEGFTAPSIKIDLKEGGKYIYAMKGPEGSEWDRVMYSSGIFKEIVPMEKIVVSDYFSDENGNKIAPASEGQDSSFPMEMTSTITFEDLGEGKSRITITYPKPENEVQFEAMLKSGMKEGWQSSLNKLAKSTK